MKEMFDWVPWFNELAKKIADGGQQYLDDRAREVIWHGESPLPNADAIDPLLFITVVANESEKAESRDRVFASLAEVFEIHPLQTDDSRDVWHLPRPISLFEYGDSDNPVNRDPVWRFLKDAVAGSLDAEKFKSVGSRLRGINWAKLTTTLFLVDGAAYLRLSKNYPAAYGVSEVVGAPNWDTYQSRIAEAKANFPGCEIYEVEMFARLHSSERSGPRPRPLAEFPERRRLVPGGAPGPLLGCFVRDTGRRPMEGVSRAQLGARREQRRVSGRRASAGRDRAGPVRKQRPGNRPRVQERLWRGTEAGRANPRPLAEQELLRT